MSRLFTSNSDHLDVASATLAAPPLTMAAWVKPQALGTAMQLFNVGTSGSNIQRMAISLVAAGAARMSDVDATLHEVISGGGILETANWHLVVGVAVDHTATGRAAYLDGANKVANAGGLSAPSAPNAMRINCTLSGANSSNALIAHVALWDIVLSDAEILQLFSVPPNQVRLADLVEYWPLTQNLSPEPSLGTTPHSMIVTGSTYSLDDPYLQVTYPLESVDYF